MAKSEPVNYKLPSGFDIELLPGERRLEIQVMDTIRAVFERYGFAPIETPCVERLEVLQAKNSQGESSQGDNIIYSIHPILPPDQPGEADKDSGSGEIRALKFDQTVPLAAYIARHRNDLVFPFARYQMDMVFRGERAKKGRYRQFRQCDIDVISRGDLSLLYDAQMPAIIAEIFAALDIGPFLIRINNRKVLTGFFQAIGLAEEKIKTCIKIVDTLEKVGPTKVKQELETLGADPEQADQILTFTQIHGDADQVLDKLSHQCDSLGSPEDFAQGIEDLQQVIQGVRSLGVAADRFCIDLSIARGLDYYTGTVYETSLVGYESLGSICSGGRYDDLVGIFVGEKMPGVGISIGLTRLLRRLMEAEILKPLPQSPAQVMVVNLDPELMPVYLQLSQQLRGVGIGVLTGFEKRGVGKQFQQADKLGIPICLIVGPEEYAAGQCRIKHLGSGDQIDVPLEAMVETIRQQLGSGE